MKPCYQLLSYIQELIQGPKDGTKPALNDVGEDFLTACIEEIERRGLAVEGLYRKPAVNKKVSELLNNGLKKKNRIFNLDLDEYDTKVLTNSVKLYLNSLPEALLTVVVYPSIIQSVRSNDITQLYNAVHKIPHDNYVLLEKLIKHFHKIVQHSPENLMTSKNLSKIFGHILLRPKAEDIDYAELAIEMLIDNYEHIFNNGVITYQPDKSQKLNKSNKRLVKIFVGTWNVSNKPISKEFLLNDWLHPASEKHVLPDIYAELDLSKEAILYDRSSREKDWLAVITKCLETLPENYTQVEAIRMLGIMMVIFVRDSFLSQITNIDKDRMSSGDLGNKGGVAIRFELYRTGICFICSHFASHINNVEARNADFKNILNQIHFKENDKLIPDHDLIFWFGDLNYRFDKLSRDSVIELINRKGYDILLQHDQLKKILIQSETIFPSFKEAEICFKPTYKYVPGTVYTFSEHRTPAYCDRILWRGRHVRNYFYKSHDNFKLSDHKPVSGFFLCKIKTEGQRVFKVNLESYQNKVLVDKRKLDFGIVKFMQLFQDSITVTNLKTVPVGFQFVDHVNLTKYSNLWLKISPKNGIIDPGEREDIVFTLQVTEKVAWKFNSGEEIMKDKFYLRISGEKDTPIKVNGAYKPSVFGFSMDTLAKLTKPIIEMSFDELRAIELKEHPWIGDDPMARIPKSLWTLVDYLYKNSLHEENLFVKEGNYFEIIHIRDWLDADKDLSQISVSACSIAQCILLLLKSTKEPLIEMNAHPMNQQNVSSYNKLLVEYITSFLCFLLKFREQNKLTANILGEIFASAIMHSNDVVSKKYMSGLIMKQCRNKSMYSDNV
ncbi:hypothetical protein M8J76_016060 [Diaphorina citri]|nr:hypothetical protein M8J75_013670 [Diaphorina citri]KAI5737716.1 hypothetical protein M8J76_016060 [Diaphorina citri]